MCSVNRCAAAFSNRISCRNGYFSLREKPSGAHCKARSVLGGHRHNHDEHGGRSHDRIGVCCGHNKLLHSNDVQFGMFTPFHATFFLKISAMSSVLQRYYQLMGKRVLSRLPLIGRSEYLWCHLPAPALWCLMTPLNDWS